MRRWRGRLAPPGGPAPAPEPRGRPDAAHRDLEGEGEAAVEQDRRGGGGGGTAQGDQGGGRPGLGEPGAARGEDDHREHPVHGVRREDDGRRQVGTHGVQAGPEQDGLHDRVTDHPDRQLAPPPTDDGHDAVAELQQVGRDDLGVRGPTDHAQQSAEQAGRRRHHAVGHPVAGQHADADREHDDQCDGCAQRRPAQRRPDRSTGRHQRDEGDGRQRELGQDPPHVGHHGEGGELLGAVAPRADHHEVERHPGRTAEGQHVGHGAAVRLSVIARRCERPSSAATSTKL